MAKGMSGRQQALARDLDHDVRTSTDPANFDPFYAAIFPLDDSDLEALRRDEAEYFEYELDDLYCRTGWGPGPGWSDEDAERREADEAWDEYWDARFARPFHDHPDDDYFYDPHLDDPLYLDPELRYSF